MLPSQPGILAPLPAVARYLSFRLQPGGDPRAGLQTLASHVDASIVVGLGPALVAALDASIDGLRTFPRWVAADVDVPSTSAALWVWLRGDDRGQLVHAGRAVCAALGSAFALQATIDGFKFGSGLDLTGYEDGTENPTGQDAIDAAFITDGAPGLVGSSFVSVQRWVHDLARFDAMDQVDQDHAIGRRRSDNEELDEAPESAHVKRTAQESFDPEAFVLRRSMPWADGTAHGLNFVAFGHSVDAFEAQLRRMVGAEDGIVDALFRFTRPVTGAHFWCPPVRDGRLDLGAVGL